MNEKTMAEQMQAWFAEHGITDVEIGTEEKEDGTLTVVTFPVEEEENYPDYDIIATAEEGGYLILYVDYCAIPDVDELELLRFLNDMNQKSMFNLTAEDGRLCFGYAVPMSLLRDGEQMAHVFFDFWDGVDAIKEEIIDAFGWTPEDELTEEDEDEEGALPAPAEADSEDDGIWEEIKE